MTSKIQELTNKKLINPPRWLPTNVHFETIMGSAAYGTSIENSDIDIYGFCIPEKFMLFPHLAGEISGFGKQQERFQQFQQHHIIDTDALGGKSREYDIQIFNIVKYFQFAMHTVRLLYEVEMILNEGDIDLIRNREHLKSIRRGEVTEPEIRQWASEKEKGLEKLYESSKLQHSPDEQKIKALLLNCLEEHYGSLQNCIVNPEQAVNALKEIQDILDKNRSIIL